MHHAVAKKKNLADVLACDTDICFACDSSLVGEILLGVWVAWEAWAPWGVDTMTLVGVASAICLALAWAASAAVDQWEVRRCHYATPVLHCLLASV